MELRRIRALIAKESYQIVRDPSTVWISVILPLVLLVLYAFGVSLDLNHLKIGLVMEERTPDAQSLADSLIHSRYFSPKIFSHREALLPEVEGGSIRGFVVIPSYFSTFRKLRDTAAPIQAIADGSEPNTAHFFQYYVQGAVANWLQQEASSSDLKGLPLTEIRPRTWFNEELDSRYCILPGSLAVIMTLVGTLLTALVISREWESGTMEALLATPVTGLELVIGKLVPYFTLGAFSMALCVVISIVLVGLPFRGSWWMLAIESSAFLFSALGQGLAISTLNRSQILAYQLALVSGILPAFMLSGFVFEIFSMPAWIQAISYSIPARYFVQSLQTLFLVGNVWPLLMWNLASMMAIALIFFLIIGYKTAKRLD